MLFITSASIAAILLLWHHLTA